MKAKMDFKKKKSLEGTWSFPLASPGIFLYLSQVLFMSR